MKVLLSQIIAGAAALALIVKLLNWAYLRPKRLEKALRKQGLNGNPYRLVVGDLKEFVKTVEEAKSITINLDDDIKQRVAPFVSKIVSKFGKGERITAAHTTPPSKTRSWVVQLSGKSSKREVEVVGIVYKAVAEVRSIKPQHTRQHSSQIQDPNSERLSFE